MKKTVECACGCGDEFPKSRMVLVRIMGHGYLVHPKHQSKIAREVNIGKKLENTIIWLAGQPLRVRWKYANAVHNAQIAFRTRLEGEKKALKAARNSWWMLVLPMWLTLGVKSFARSKWLNWNG